MARWRLNQAQKHFPEVIEKALTEGPQTITLRKGKSVVIAKSSPAKRKSHRRRPPTLEEVIRAAPRVPEFHIPRGDEVATPANLD